MAYVAISSGLRDNVRRIINTMEEAEHKALGENPEVYIDEHSTWFIDRAWGEHIHLKNAIPREWKSSDTYRAWVTIIGGAGMFEVSFTYRNERVLYVYPPNHKTSNIADINIDDPDVPQEVRTKFEHLMLKAEVTQRWDAVRGQVMDFLQNCKSLNEAIKLWPDLEHYIPKEYMTRMLAKNERSKSESKALEILSGIDTQSVMAAAVMARMASAA